MNTKTSSRRVLASLSAAMLIGGASVAMAQQDMRAPMRDAPMQAAPMQPGQMQPGQMQPGRMQVDIGREHVREALRRAGFTRIRVIDENRLQARSPDGRTVILDIAEHDERIQDQEHVAAQRLRDALQQAGYTEIQAIDHNRLQARGPDGRMISVFLEGPDPRHTAAMPPQRTERELQVRAPRVGPPEQRADRPWQEQPAIDGLLNRTQIESILEARGMSDIEDFERIGTNYHATADWYGDEVDVIVDGRTGVVLRPRAMEDGQIRARLQDEGWSEVAEIQREEDIFHVRATRNGEDFDLRVDARTGTVLDQEERS